jgi:hypothetical protein
MKRQAFEPEEEYRVIFESSTGSYSALNVPIPLSIIRRITLSPCCILTLEMT